MFRVVAVRRDCCVALVAGRAYSLGPPTHHTILWRSSFERSGRVASSADGPGCNGTYSTKISLVTTGYSNIEDGTFNSLAIRGAMMACTEANSCCLEVDMPDSTGTETDYFCEMKYASQDSDMVIGVGFLHAGATLDAATCVTDTNFAAIDVEYSFHPGGNLEGLIFEDSQGGYLAGYLAGLVAETLNGKVGLP